MSNWYEAVSLAELEEEEPVGVNVEGRQVMVVRVDDTVYALDDICTHEVAPLSEGFIEDGCIECPLHQGMFDLATGAAVKEPCVEPVRAYPVRINDDTVEIDLGGSDLGGGPTN